jgi:membrane-bound lytic murein transglycosylase D
MKKYYLFPLITAVFLLFVYAIPSDIINKTNAILCELRLAPRPTEIDLAGEMVPLQIIDVKERLDRELLVNTYWQSNTFLWIKRSHKYFPIIEPILKKNGVPDEFKYVAVIESNLTNAVSPAGARGFWQFMPETAKEYGLEITTTVDERYHLEKATEAACKYFLRAKNKLGSWSLAAASYNIGVKSIENRIQEQQVFSYYDLSLPDETARYVFRILAAKEILENPAKYGFIVNHNEKYEYPATNKIEIDSSIANLPKFAKTMGVNYKILKIHNPWLRERNLENKAKKMYQIEIPTNGY